MSDSRLPAQIGECGDDVLHTRKRLGALLDELVSCGTAEAAQLAIGEMRAVLCGLSATANKIKSLTAAARMAGMVDPASVPVEALELHPVQRPDPHQRELLLAGLHRAGDHTLDDDRDEESKP